MNDKFKQELNKFLQASSDGDFNVMLSPSGMPDEEAEIIRTLSEAVKHYKASVEYDIMKYKLTGDALGTGLWDMDISGVIPDNTNTRLIWSQEVRDMLGFKDENDFPNVLSSLTDRIHPEDKDAAVGAFMEHLADKTGKTPFDVEYRFMMKDGTYRHLHAFGTTLRDADGAPLRVAGGVEDIDERKRLQESLKVAEEKRIALTNMENIMNGLNAMICVTDPKTDELLFINDKMRYQFGIKRDCIGEKCYNVIRGFESRCEFCPCKQLDKTPNKEVVWEQEDELTGRIFRYFSRYIKWPGGKTVHIQNSVDITDIKKAQTKLEGQNLRLNLLLGGLNIGFWDRTLEPGMAYDDNRAKIWWSDEFRKLLGYKDEEDFPNEVGPWLNSVHPDDLEMTIDAMNAFLGDKTGQTPYDVENRMITKQGEYRWFRSFGSAIRDETGIPLRTAGATEDINIRKAAEAELAERGEFIQTLFDNAPVGVTLFDENFNYIDCNEHILKMFGGITRWYYSSFFGSKDHSPEFQPDGKKSYDKAIDIIRRAIILGENIKFEWVHQMPDGEPFPVEITMTRIPQGNKYIGLAYVYDMREQTRLKQELEETLHKAEDANKAKSDFLAKMSHEIRTPMNAILGITEIQLRSGTLSKDTESALYKIYDSGNLLMCIINDILDLSKIEADKLEIIPVNYEISSLINDTVQLNLLRYESKPIEFSIKLDENTPTTLTGDELRIKQVLNNLLSNAYKYTDQGEIELALYIESIDPSENNENDVMLIVSVRDTGQGMTEDEVANLFMEYTRFNMEANRTTVGTGLGMSITKSLVDMMGGSISVESRVREGSVFTVSIPQKRVGTAVCGAGLADKLQNSGHRSASMTDKVQFVREYMPYGSVLVVDDVDSNVYVAKGMLMPYGLNIDTSSSGFDAIDKVKKGNVYDVIFMDHMMPKMDGIETVKKIRAMGYTGSIIALTANAIIGQAKVFLDNGFDAYISKPIDSRELNHVLNEYIRSKKPAEVVEAARLEQAERQEKESPDDSAVEVSLADLRRYVISDAKKAITILEDIYSRIDSLSDADIESYTVTVHGMKSSLANLGERKLSEKARRLEEAGSEKNIDIISKKTKEFINALRKLTKEKDKEKNETDVSVSDEDMKILNEKLSAIKTACDDYDINTVRSMLGELTKRSWPHEVTEVLDELSTHVLHSDFEAASKTAEKL